MRGIRLNFNIKIFVLILILIILCFRIYILNTKEEFSLSTFQGEWLMFEVSKIKKFDHKKCYSYITDKNEFWSFSSHSDNILIDSSLKIRDNGIYSKGICIYEMKIKNDSIIYLQHQKDKSYELIKVKSSYKKELAQWKRDTELKKLIVGTWTLDSFQYFDYLEPYFFIPLKKEYVLKFNKNGRMEIKHSNWTQFTLESVSYSIKDSTLYTISLDMFSSFDAKFLSNDSLIITSKKFKAKKAFIGQIEVERYGYDMLFIKDK